MTKRYITFLAIGSLVFALAKSNASTPGSTPSMAKNFDPAAQVHVLGPDPSAAPDDSTAKRGHTFRVTDKKGPLLTCVAPQIDTNPDTDLFEDCALAPGRTLDEVMHTFVGAIHYEQKQHEEERAKWTEDLEERSSQTAAQK